MVLSTGLILHMLCLPAFLATAEQAGPSASRPASAPAIELINYRDGETVPHPVVLIRGRLSDPGASSITVVNGSSARETREMKGLVHKGRFKVLTELLPGANRLLIRSGSAELPLTITYKPLTTRYIVRCIYLTDSTGATEYLTPLPEDPQDYVSKLDTAMKVLQSFTAERLYDLGFGRRTFRLELDDDGKVKVHTFKCAKPAEHYYRLDDGTWYGQVAEELEPAFPTRRAKNVAIAGFTRYDPATGKAHGHTALGGGSLALFGSGNLFTWPSRLCDVQRAFLDDRPIDPAKTFSDSAFRHVFWGSASTTMGATLHELAHTFDLPHTREPMDIMTRGFDHFNRAFTFFDPPHAGRKERFEFPDHEVACFPPISATALLANRWFADEGRAFSDGDPARARLDESGENIIAESEAPLRYIGLGVKGDAVHHVIPPEGSRRVVLPLPELRRYTGPDAFDIRIIDERGQVTIVDGLLAGPCVQAWRFSRMTQPWRDQEEFVPVDDQKLQDIIRSAARAELVRFDDRFIDFTRGLPDAAHQDVAGYACRTIRSDRERKIRILTGSDDALRVWLNGQLVTKVLELRPAGMDAESSTATLRSGDNTLLVEVSQAGGGWGLYLRLEDESGRKLRLMDSGELASAEPAR